MWPRILDAVGTNHRTVPVFIGMRSAIEAYSVVYGHLRITTIHIAVIPTIRINPAVGRKTYCESNGDKVAAFVSGTSFATSFPPR